MVENTSISTKTKEATRPQRPTTTILVIGGYGNTGRIIVKLLYQYCPGSINLIVAGRNLERAQATVNEVRKLNNAYRDDDDDDGDANNKTNTKTNNKKVIKACYVDASLSLSSSSTSSSNNNNKNTKKKNQLTELFTKENVTLVILAAPSSTLRENVMEAALKIGNIDYMDIQYSTEQMDNLRNTYEKEIQSKQLCFITQCGFHPGLPAVMIRHAAATMMIASSSSSSNKEEKQEEDFVVVGVKSAIVGGVINIDYKNLRSKVCTETIEEFAMEIANAKMKEYKNGKWMEGSIMHPKKIDFGPPFGEQQCIPMYLEELQELISISKNNKNNQEQQQPNNNINLVETGFYVGGLNYVVDNFIIPIVMLGLCIWPSKLMKNVMGKLLFWGMLTFSRPPYGTLLQVEATGIRQNDDNNNNNKKEIKRTISVSHPDGYALTAISVTALVIQYLGYSISNNNDDDDENGDGRSHGGGDQHDSGMKQHHKTSSSIRRPGLWLQGSIAEPNQLLEDMAQMGLTVKMM